MPKFICSVPNEYVGWFLKFVQTIGISTKEVFRVESSPLQNNKPIETPAKIISLPEEKTKEEPSLSREQQAVLMGKILKNPSKHLRQILSENKFTQKKLADILEISQGYVSLLVTSRARPSEELVQKIIDRFASNFQH